MKLWKPKFIEHSRVPIWLSKVAPIEIWAINDKTHETIHYQQQLELLFVFHWALYFLFWVIGMIRFRSGMMAYFNNPFEIEAYKNEADIDYLATRKRYSWIKYDAD